MFKVIARIVATLALALCHPAHSANTWGTDLSDMWWNPSESGWGANIAHQRDIVFLTLYVYGSDNRVRWYAATEMRSRGVANPFVFDGALYEVTGPYFGLGFFNPANVSVRQVGTATLSAPFISSATLSYSVDGVSVTKSIERQTFRENNLAGSYIAGTVSTTTGCTFGNGATEDAAQVSISHSGSAITISSVFSAGSACTYTGAYSQTGKMGRATGSVSCNNGARGTFDIFELEAGAQGFSGRYTANFPNFGTSCRETGRLAALLR